MAGLADLKRCPKCKSGDILALHFMLWKYQCQVDSCGEKFDEPVVLSAAPPVAQEPEGTVAAKPIHEPQKFGIDAVKQMHDMFRVFVEEVESVGGNDQPEAWTVYHSVSDFLRSPALPTRTAPQPAPDGELREAIVTIMRKHAYLTNSVPELAALLEARISQERERAQDRHDAGWIAQIDAQDRRIVKLRRELDARRYHDSECDLRTAYSFDYCTSDTCRLGRAALASAQSSPSRSVEGER